VNKSRKDAGEGIKYRAKERRSKKAKEIRKDSNSINPEKINC
jgi:hypothetical protein